MVKRHWIDWSLLRFNDVITIYNKNDNEWTHTTVEGVQWTDRYEKENSQGKISIAKYVNITFPEGTFEGLILDPANEEDAIFYGVVDEEVTAERGHRISDLIAKHKGGRIQSVNDNSNRTHLKNIKVVIA